MDIKEIKLEDLVPETFVEQKIDEIKAAVGDNKAINALSGGVDSSVSTMIGHRALGDNLLSYFTDTGLMREGEPDYVIDLFNNKLGIKVENISAQDLFFNALKGKTDPEEKRQAITDTFYKDVFGTLVRETGAKFLFHGTNYTDIEETVAGVKRQHNILSQLGIDPEKEFGYVVLEPLLQLRKPAVRAIGKYVELPLEIYNRPPFPGPGLSVRVIGEVTPEKVAIIRKATQIVEEVLKSEESEDIFQYLAILHNDKVTGVKHIKEGLQRDYGMQIEVRCWNSKDAVTATPTRLAHSTYLKMSDRITEEIPEVVSVTYNITRKPRSTIEAE